MINIGARVSSFVQGCAAARVSLASLTNATSTAARNIINLSGALIGVAGVAGFGALIKHSAHTIDMLGKLSDRIGITTEALAGLRLGAALSDVGIEALEGGLAKMLRTIDAARHGTNSAVETFQRLGLSADALAQMSPDQALAEIADALKGVTNASERAAIAIQLFGRGGLPLLNMLNEGSEGLRKMQEEAERMGLTFSRIDAAKVEIANDSFTRLRLTIEALAQRIAIGLAPAISVVVKSLQEMSIVGNAAGQNVSNSLGLVGDTVAVIADAVHEVSVGFASFRALQATVFASVINGLLNVANAIVNTFNLIPGMGATVPKELVAMAVAADQTAAAFQRMAHDADIALTPSEKMRLEAEKMALAAQQAAANSNKFAPTSDPLLDAMEEHDRAREQNAASVQQMIDQLQQEASTVGMSADQIVQYRLQLLVATDAQRQFAQSLSDSIAMQNESLNTFNRMVEDAGRVFEETRTPFEKYIAELDRLDELLDAGLISWETYGRAVDKARESLDAASGAKVPTPEGRFDNIDTVFGQMRVATSTFEKPPTRKEQEKQTKEQVKTNQKLDRIIAIEEKKANEGFA